MLSDNDDDDDDVDDVDLKDIMKDSSSDHYEEEAKEEANEEQLVPATKPLAGSISEPAVLQVAAAEEAKGVFDEVA